MIVSNIEELKKYLTSFNLKTSIRMNDFLERAQADVVVKILGEDLEELLEIDVEESASDGMAKLRKLTGRAISVMAYLIAVPELDLQLSEAGFVVQSNDAVTPASRQRVDKLIESLRERQSADYNNLLQYLVENSAPSGTYQEWRSTKQFDILSCGVILHGFELERYAWNYDALKMSSGFNEFYRLIPSMEFALFDTVSSYISEEYAYEILDKIRQAKTLLHAESCVIEMVKAAVVAAAYDDRDLCVSLSIKARDLMLRNIELFPTFKASKASKLSAPDLGDKTVINLL